MRCSRRNFCSSIFDRDRSIITVMLRLLFTCVVALACAPVAGVGQVPSEKVAFTNAPKISRPLPFKVGESLLYEVSASRLIFSGTIGELKMTVAKANDADGHGLLNISA